MLNGNKKYEQPDTRLLREVGDLHAITTQIGLLHLISTHKSVINLAFLNINCNAVSSLEIISAVAFIPDCSRH